MAPTLRARLISKQPSPEISVQAFRDTVKFGRKIIAEERQKSRSKARRYAAHVRTRSFQKGYQEGLRAAQEECTAALRALRSCYEDVLNAAKNDTHALATALAERIIDTTLLERPEVLLAWIQEALQLLKRSRNLNVSFHPRYSGIMERILPELPQGITTQADSSLNDSDFLIQSESGGVEFSWRTVVANTSHFVTQEAQ